MRGCGVRPHQVHVGRWYARSDAVRRTAWFVRAHNTRGVRYRSAGENARTPCGTNARYPRAVRVIISMRARTLIVAVARAWQFVLGIDEQLFTSFAPRNLKRALAKSAELVVASLPTFHGLDLAPVLELIAALTMVGCLIGAIIVPQNSLLDDAKLTLCGTHRARLWLRSGRAPPRTVFGVSRRVGQLGVGGRQVRLPVVGRPERRGRRLDRRTGHRFTAGVGVDGAARRVDGLVPAKVCRRRACARHQRRAPVRRTDVRRSFQRRVQSRLVEESRPDPVGRAPAVEVRAVQLDHEQQREGGSVLGQVRVRVASCMGYR